MLTLPNTPTIPLRMNTVSRELGSAFTPLYASFWPKYTLTDEGSRVLSRATFEAAVEALLHSRGELSNDEQALVLSVLISNFISTQVAAEVGKGLFPALRPENLIRAK